MPCYQVRTYSVEFKAHNRAILDLALKSLDWIREPTGSDKVLSFQNGAIVINLDKGTAQIRAGYQEKLNALRRSYSRQAVNAAAKRMGWQVGTAVGVQDKGRLMKRVG
jgi:hypothetical protein